MKIKTTIFLILISISAVFCTNTFAVSKNDIIGYVNSQSVCGDTALFNTYKKTFTRLLKQKKLTEKELNTIYSHLQNSVGILNSKGVCKIADLNKLTASEKNLVYNKVMAAAGIITNAPMLQFGEQDVGNEGSSVNINKDNTEIKDTNINNGNKVNSNKTEGTKVTINTQDNTMDIYENGVLMDKVSMSTQKMTYTGANVSHILIVVICMSLIVICLYVFIKISKTDNLRTAFIKNILVSFIICMGLISVFVIVFSNKIESVKAMIDLISISGNNQEIKVELNQDKSIKKYPSYASNYATLKIDKLNIENNVYFGDVETILALGIGHSTWSEMPTEDGIVVYSGHNKKDKLNNLKNISVGDKIVVDTSYATCTYEVAKISILKDYETDKLAKIDNEETLILYTCYPFDTYVYTNQRFVVYSVLKETKWK